MKKAHLRFSPEILKRLGEELNPFLDKGVLELAKNAYDADAINCKITLEKIDRPGGSITITDDGVGMSVDDILSGWLVLGRSGKSAKRHTRLGRVPSGSKGLGRLAALRLGKRVEMITRPKAERDALHRLVIDWSDFEGVRAVDEVPLNITTHPRPASKKPGTTILLEDLNSHMTRVDVRRLARELILLADPFGDDPKGFKPVLVAPDAPEFADLAALVEKRYFSDAEYHLSARIDEHGHTSAKVTDHLGQKLFSADHDAIASDEARAYECPAATFEFWVFVFDPENFSTRVTTIGEVKEWLEAFGGIHLYQNGIRVSPYGDLNNDWTGLNLRRARHQEDSPSTNTVIGRLMITDREELLQQKTDRSGFIETAVFRELRRFAVDATDWLYRRRNEVSQARRAKEREAALQKEKPATRALRNAIASAPPKARRQLQRAFAANERSHQIAQEKLQSEIQLYRTLSTVGITASTFSHDTVDKAAKTITLANSTIERRARARFGEDYPKAIGKSVGDIKDALKTLALSGSATFSLLDHDKRRTRRVDLHEVIERVTRVMNPFMRGRDIEVLSELSEERPFLRASEAAVESILTNFFNNAATAFEDAQTAARQLHLRTRVDGGTVLLRVFDNGPGIKGLPKKDIWLPGVSTRRNGTGLGLTIVRDTVLDLGGNADVVEHGELGGAEFIVHLPILKI